MRILSRKIVTSKSAEEVIQIVKSSAYRSAKTLFSGNTFFIYCARRHRGGYLSLVPINGTIVNQGCEVKITFSVLADFGFYLGASISLIGFIGLFLCTLFYSSTWIPGVGMIFFGAFVGAQSWWEGISCLDQLELKLTR